ncbi:SH3 domain-containing protein [Neobacillus rhizophilus]|uniref:SH3 domain-containing protein n=1 Tax=Neobacillus rhizophilus TaxID=2833579 RepID=A0A942U7M5_9BACI|nr:SH3 domain-containing protein [Neobacillus rhizophilus]MBS4212409.1 SH3 domain-containing protein [Neobacillus rhizophilus]
MEKQELLPSRVEKYKNSHPQPSVVKKAILPTFCFAVLSAAAFEEAVFAESNSTQTSNIQSAITRYVNVDIGSLNLRKSASTSSAVLAALPKGTAVTVYSEVNGWAMVTASGKSGYVSSQFLSNQNSSSAAVPPGPTPTAASATKYVNIESGSLNMRSGTSTSDSIIAKLSKGTEVKFFSVTNGWAKIEVNGKTGYVSSAYLADKTSESSNVTTPAPQPAATKYVNIVSGSLNMRSGASTSDSIIAKLTKGTEVKFFSATNGWAKIEVNGKTGYVSSAYLVDKPSESSSVTAPAPQPAATKYVNIESGSLNMRSGTSTSDSIIAKLSKGTEVKFFSVTNGWAKIEVNGKSGYVSSAYLADKSSESSSVPTPAPQSAATKYVNIDSASKLNVRKSPSSGSAILTKLTNETEVTVYSEENGWAKIMVNGQEGYVSSEYLAPAKAGSTTETKKEEPIPVTKFVNVSYDSPLNMLKSAAADASILVKLARGTEVTVLSEENGWAKIEAYGQIGYVDPQYLSETKPAAGTDSPAENNTEQKDTAIVEKYVNVVYGSSLNMRAEASTTASVLTKLARGTIVTVNSEENGWAKVTANGKTGYVSAQYLSASEPFNPNVTNSNIEKVYENYNISLADMVKLEMAVNPQTDKKYAAYIRADALTLTSPSSGIVNGTVWNVRGGAGTDFWTIAQVKSQEQLQILGKVTGTDGFDWYQVVYNKSWVNASPEDVSYYVNPNNFLSTTVDSLQFLKLSATANLNAEEVNQRILSGKGILQGTASAFITAGQTYGINEIYLISHALLETSNGTSKLASGVVVNGKTVYNMYGIGAYDNTALESGAQFAYNAGWFTPEAAIIGGAQFIANGYINAGQDTLYKMRWNPGSAAAKGSASHQYASDIGWAAKQVFQIHNLYSLLVSYKLILEIPQYK